MFTINGKTKLIFNFSAISIKDTKAKDKKPYTIFDQGVNKYIVLDPTNVQMNDLDWSLSRAFSQLKQPTNIDLNSFIKLIKNTDVEAFLVSSFYNYEIVCTNPYDLHSKKIEPLAHNFIVNASVYKKHERVIKALIEASNFSRKLMLMPNKDLSPKNFVDLVIKEFKPYEHLVDINVLDYETMLNKGMGLITAVGRGSIKEYLPYMLSIRFKNTTNEFTLVGKGITFDTGGMDIKIQSYMLGMHMDMTGAAVTVGTMLALCKLGIKANYGVVVSLSNNDCGPWSYRCNDIYKSYNGLTVEISNTDAEGRLILADGMTYAIRDLKAKRLATIATLTGAILVAYGDVYTGHWTTEKTLGDKFAKSAMIAGEYTWPMPFHREYDDLIHNYTINADCINCAINKSVSSNTAAAFLHQFSENKPYMHFDIAGSSGRNFNGKNHPIPIMLRSVVNFVITNYAKRK